MALDIEDDADLGMAQALLDHLGTAFLHYNATCPRFKSCHLDSFNGEMIQQLQVVVYPTEPAPARTDVFDRPVFELVLENMQLMDQDCRPALFLCKIASDSGKDVMEVEGGCGLYFIQATDDRGFWYTPYDAFGGTDRVDLCRRSQEHSVAAKYTWRFDDARAIVEHYFRYGTMLFTYDWMSVKQMC